MTKKSTGGFKRGQTDQERAELRGTLHEGDFESSSPEGQTRTGSTGSGDTTSLRGHTTGGLTPKNIEKDKQRFNEPPKRE